jgi:guanylate kinase
MPKQREKKGKLVVVSGPSGVGKGTICSEVAKRLDNVYISVSVTTRPKGFAEVNGRDYWFVTRQEFQQLIDGNNLLEYAEVFGNFYGTPAYKVKKALDAGKTVILEIDVQGGLKIKQKHPEAVLIFILPPDKQELAKRISGRGRDEAKEAEKRLNFAGTETLEAKKFYEYMVVNDDLEKAVKQVIKIIEQNTGVKE